MKDGKPTRASLDEQLEKLYRENVKISEEIQHIISGGSNDMNLLDSMKVLAGLREASEESAAQLQASQGQRASGGKRKPLKGGSKVASAAAAVSTEDAGEPPVASSPRISIGNAASRFNAKEKSSRSNSIPATREASVKIEDGAESVASSTDAPSSKHSYGNRPSNRLVLNKGEIVFCRHDLKNYDTRKGEQPEGEGILCRVTNVIGEGKQRRYEVQDADTSGEAPPPQRASVSQLIQIPESNKGLSDLPKGKSVLAQYPDTTTFYKAEVSETWRGSLKGSDGDESGLIRLMFQDDLEVRAVERRFVLSDR